MTTLIDAFEYQLTLEDEGYESGSEGLNIPTSLHSTPCLYHVSANENFFSDLLHHLRIRHTHLNDTSASALYTPAWCLVMMKAPYQIAAHSLVEQYNLHL